MSEEEIRKIFSRNLTSYLELNNMTQKDLVNFIGVSSSTVSNWCTGQKLPRMDKIQTIANWLGIENSDLLEDKKSKTIPALKDTYFNFAKEMQDKKVSEEDMEKLWTFYDMIKNK